MSKKRPTESSWDSDEELLNDTSGNAITAFPKISELELLGDDGELDEDALLGTDETGMKSTSVSFANDSAWSLVSRQRSKSSVSHQEQVGHDEQEHVDEQAFVFEETDTADLEDELNVGGQEEGGSGYHMRGEDYAEGLYHQGEDEEASHELTTDDDQHDDYTSSRLTTGNSGDMGYIISETEQAAYGDERGAEFSDSTGVGYMGDSANVTQEDMSGVELGYEEPVEQEGQVHLEYEDSRPAEKQGDQEPKSTHFESESDSDDESSRHSRGKFTSERTGVISLTPATTREAIPDTLEINDEQAAQIEQFMSDKSQRGKGKSRGRGRLSARSRLGNRPGKGPQQNPKMLQGSRMAPFPRAMLGQQLQMGFPFQGGQQNRGPFPVGMLNPQGPFPPRLLNPGGPFSGVQNQRQIFSVRSGDPRGSFPIAPLNMLLGGPRGPFPRTPQGRFPGVPNRGPFPRGPQPLGSQRLPQQILRSPQPGPARGPPPNQLRPQGSFQQRVANPAQFGPRAPQMGQQRMRAYIPGPGKLGPRPLMEQSGPGVRYAGTVRPPLAMQHGQPIPSLVKPIAGPGKSPLEQQQMRPGQANPLMPPAARRISPHQRLGPMLGQNRPQNPIGPRFMAGMPASAFQGNHQSQMDGQGTVQGVRKHKIYINPRFQDQQAGDGDLGQGRTVKMGVPLQQKKAKLLLERAIQTQNKQATSVQVTVAGAKRKSTSTDDVPNKVVVKSNVKPEKVVAEPVRVVQAGNVPTQEDSQKMKALLDEQKRQREIIQKRKELARQKQAAIKRMELEKKLKEEGKTIEDILGTTKTKNTEEQNQVVAPVKHISGSVASRLGPPPNHEQAKGPSHPHGQLRGPAPIRMIQPVPHGLAGVPKTQQFPGTPQQLQAKTPVQTSPLPNQLRMAGPTDPRMRGPPAGSDMRFRGPPQSSNFRPRGPLQTADPRFQAPSASNQFRAQQPNPDPRYRAPQPASNNQFRGPPTSTESGFRGPPPSTEPGFRGPPPMTDSRLRNPSLQIGIQPPSAPSQAVSYSAPPPASSQTIRFSSPHSAPPQVSVQVHPTQQFQPQYPPPGTPASAPISQPSGHYSQPSQPQATVYVSSVPHHTQQATSYQAPAYPPPAQNQYQPQSHYPPPASQSYVQPSTSQYELSDPYQTTVQPSYQTPHPQPPYQTTPQQTQYQATPAQSQYQTAPLAQSQYQTAPLAQSQYQTDSLQPQYQASAESHYQVPTSQQYQSLEQTYGGSSDPHYQHTSHSYYGEPQPIQTVTSQVPTSSPAGDQRTVQHQSPVGQRIQTIGQRVQPVTGTQMRSIIHNVGLQSSYVEQSTPARLVQSRTAGSRVVTEGQVQVLKGPQKILIQNLPQMATKETLIKICRHFGQVLGVNLMPEQSKAVVHFQKGEQAAKCVAKCNQKCLHKTRLTVKLLPS